MPTAASQVLRLTPSQEGAYEDMKGLLAAGERPVSCYFADNDLIAIGAMKALTEAGYRIPEDISIVGFDDNYLSQLTNPALTTIHQDADQKGILATDMILKQLRQEPVEKRSIILPISLVERKSVKSLH